MNIPLNNKGVSPLAIDLLISFYCKIEKRTDLEFSAQQEIISRYLENNVIKKSGTGYYELTERGVAWLKMICQTPLPVAAWTDPRLSGDLR